MRHPTDGVLRRLLDEPAGVTDPDRHHVAACARCLDTLTTMRRDADAVGAVLGAPDADDADVDAAWRRLSAAARSAGPAGAVAAPVRAGRLGGALRRPVVAGVAAAALLAGAGAAAANGWLPIFRTEQVAPVSLSATDLVALPDLRAYGEVAGSGEPDLREVADAAAAEAGTGLDLPEVTTLPRGVTGEPDHLVVGEVSATFTFSADRAARTAAAAGEPLPAPPAGLDGTQVRLVAGPGAVQVWSQPAGVPSLLVARAVAPSAFSTGVPFEAVRDYVLSLPGLPDDVAAQLRTFTADGATLPIPVPADQVTTSSADVRGVEATVLEARDRTMAAVVWVTGGEVTVVAGALGADEVLSIARELR